MLLFEGTEGFYIEGTAITTGNFDGVHLGHQFLLKELVKEAKKRSLASVVVVFYPHPRAVLNGGDSDFRYLNCPSDKNKYFEELGIDAVVRIPFNLDIAALSAQDFIQRILIESLNMKFFLVGYDHRLGNSKFENNILKIAENKTFEAKECEPFTLSIGGVSSSKIRKHLISGEVNKAATMLGRYYSMRCMVEDGRKLGRSIGYPTANLKLKDLQCQIPMEGVYAVKVKVTEEHFGGMLMIGNRPTLNDGRGLTMEVYIFDFNRDIYHQQIDVSFVEFVRHNQRFDDIESLKNQLMQDEIVIRELLNNK